jgi:hypothetical protein
MSMKIPLNIEKDLQNRFEKLPSNMTAKDIAKFLGVSYNIAHAPDFPRLKTPGRRLVIIPKIGFIEWYLSNCVTAADI